MGFVCMESCLLVYNTTVHTSIGQTPFFTTLGCEATVSVHWIYLVPEADREMESSDWTETIQERFQRAYAGMREWVHYVNLHLVNLHLVNIHLVNFTFGQPYIWSITTFGHFTFRPFYISSIDTIRQLWQYGLKFGQLSYLKAWFPLSQLEYQLNKSMNICTQTSQQLKISVS